MANSISSALAWGKWQSAIRMAKENPKSTKVWAPMPGPIAGAGAPYKIDKTIHGLPIHEAVDLSHAVPVEVIEALARVNPVSLQKKDLVLKRLPLHLAVARRRNNTNNDPEKMDRIVRCLLKYCKEAVGETDKTGKTPLHYALEQKYSVEEHPSNSSSSSPTILRMLHAYPNVAKSQDRGGLTPLHWACANGYPTEIIDALLKSYPTAAIIKAGNGMTPTKLALKADAPDKAQVLELLKTYSIQANQQFRTAIKPTSQRVLV